MKRRDPNQTPAQAFAADVREIEEYYRTPKVCTDSRVPVGELWLEDPISGDIVGKIVNIGTEPRSKNDDSAVLLADAAGIIAALVYDGRGVAAARAWLQRYKEQR